MIPGTAVIFVFKSVCHRLAIPLIGLSYENPVLELARLVMEKSPSAQFEYFFGITRAMLKHSKASERIASYQFEG